MVSTPTTNASPKKPVSPRHALLEELIGIAVKQAGDQFLDLASKLAGALIDATDGDTKLIQSRIRAGNLLRNRNFAFLHLATTTLEKTLRREIADLAPVSKVKVRVSEQPLSLVSYEEMDNQVALSDVSKPFETQYSDQLQTLNVRLAFLMDRDILRVSQNPFRPAVFLEALQETWTEFDPEEESAELLKPLIKPGMFIELGPMFDALNLALQTKGGMPDRPEKRRRTDEVKRGRSNQANLAQQLRQFFASSDVPGSAAGAIVDGIADGMMNGVDLSIPELPTSALNAASTWVPNAAARAIGEAAVAGMAGAASASTGAALAGAVVPGASGMAGVAGVAAGVAGTPGIAAGVVPGGAVGMPGMVAGVVPAGMPGMPGMAIGVSSAGAPGMAIVVGAAGGAAMVGVPGAMGVPGDIAMTGGAAMAGVPGAIGVPGGVAMPAGAVHVADGFVPVTGWTQGPAQGFHTGAMSNEDAQRMSQIVAKQPLLDYLARLQKTVPYESMGPGAAAPTQTQAAGANAAIPASAESAKIFYLPSIKQSMPQGSLSRADESTIDLLSAVFETVFRDQNISQEIRDLIRFLQIPVLKAALVDKNFFFQEAHPARRLLELLSRMGWEHRKGPDDPLFQAMQRSVDRVGRDYEHELSVFTEAINELEAQIEAEEKAAAVAIAEPIAAALKQEKMAESNKLAKNAVALRIDTGEVIALLENFLEQRWVTVMTVAYSIEDDKPGAVNNATKTMDELIWSTKPKLKAEERKQLISKLPGLLSALNKWLDVIKWQDADRLQFFAELAECHASIVRAPLDISAERQLEISMQVAQKAAERRLALQAAAEAKAAAEAEQPAPDPEEEDAIVEVDGLTRGMWLEFEQEDGSTRKVKLAWISPRRTLYIFSTATRQEAFSMSGDELTKRFRENSAYVVRSEGVVAVALSEALSRTADNDASIELPSSAFG